MVERKRWVEISIELGVLPRRFIGRPMQAASRMLCRLAVRVVRLAAWLAARSVRMELRGGPG